MGSKSKKYLSVQIEKPVTIYNLYLIPLL